MLYLIVLPCVLCHQTSLTRGGSYIDSLKWIIVKKAFVNPKTNDTCFQLAVTVALNHENIKNKTRKNNEGYFFLNYYNWKEMDLPAEP